MFVLENNVTLDTHFPAYIFLNVMLFNTPVDNRTKENQKCGFGVLVTIIVESAVFRDMRLCSMTFLFNILPPPSG
jgi:hypothetical protein